MSSPRETIDRALELYLELIRSRPELAIEFEASIIEFYGGPPPYAPARETLLAARRQLEWFVLERHSPTLASRPAEALAASWGELVEASSEDPERQLDAQELPGEHELRALYESFAGIFEVSSVQPGSGAWLRDMAGLGEYPIVDEAAASAFMVGDLILGRLFPLGEGGFLLSTAAGIHRDERLKKALAADLERTREERAAGKVLRVSQRHLEAMFWMRGQDAGSAEADAPVDPRPAARRFFLDSGLDEASIEQLFEHLRAVPMDPERLVVGAGDVLGSLLDELAFETDIALDHARRELLAVWTWYGEQSAVGTDAAEAAAAAPSATEATPDRSDAPRASRETALEEAAVERAMDPAERARAALQAFDAARESGADLDALFGRLESELEIETDAEQDDELEDSELPSSRSSGEQRDPDAEPAEAILLAGSVLTQIVDEFLWEAGLTESGPRLVSFARLHLLAEFSPELPAFEDLDDEQLLRFTCFWLPEHRVLRDGDDARELVDALDSFCAWSEDSHCIPLRTSFAATLGKLRESLPRIIDAGRALGRAAIDPDDTGELHWISELTETGARLVDSDGTEHEVRLPGRLREFLGAGDGLRGRVQIDGSLSVFCCYPPEARGLMGA